MLKFTVLTENQEKEGLECEHGLSFYIEYKNKKYLLDAGKTEVFMRNAAQLGIDLRKVDAAVLSHAHYDHADGFETFFQVNDTAKVFACAPGKLADCWSVGSESTRYIGIKPEILEKYGQRFCWVSSAVTDAMDDTKKEAEGRIVGLSGTADGVDGATERTNGVTGLTDGVWLVPHSTPNLSEIGARTGMYRRCCTEERAYTADQQIEQQMEQQIGRSECFHETEMSGECLVPDDFAHEQSLVFETDDGLVIFNSCSHGGVANIVSEVRRAFPKKQIIAYIGGFHLKAPGVDALNCTEQEVEELGRSLLGLGIRQIYTGHCTGKTGYEVLKRVMGDVLQPLYPGLRAEV